ncbi:hypothetical protein [Phocaeicola sp.]
MKKILFFILIGLLSACTNDEMFIETTEQDTCEITFDVTIPQAAVASRSFNDGTSVSINDLTLLLFDKNGILVGKQTATSVTRPFVDNGVYKGKYKVTLAQTDEKRIIHFVANYGRGSIANSGTENAILSALNVENGTDVYWQRMVLENGVYKEEGGTPSIGIVRLIRNFACIQVSDETSSDFLQGYALVNEPKQGTVAPYYRNAQGGFPSFTEKKTYAEFEEEGYYGVEPVAGGLDTSTPQNSEFTNDEKYVYERNHSGDNLDNPTFVIVKGMYDGTSYFYRVDIAKNLKYYNLLRNFRYIIQIKSVTGKGYESVSAAQTGASYNNVDVELKVEEITDGASTLKVTPTDITVVNGTTSLYIDYEYKPSEQKFSNIEPEYTSGKAITKVEKVSGRNQFLVTLKEYEDHVDGGKQTETFTIITGSGLSRKVRITLIDKFYFLEPEIAVPGGGQSYYNYSFTIPPELVESMFPLELLIRESTCSFTPAPGEQMSVELIDDPLNEGRKTWCYKRVLKWTDYSQELGTKVQCLFKPNETPIEGSKTFTVTNKLTNEYFANNAEVTLKGKTVVKNIALTDAYNGVGRSVELTFNITGIEPVTVSMENLSYQSTTSGNVSGQSGNSFVYTPSAAGTQKITLATTSANEKGAVTLTADGIMYSKVTNKRNSYISNTQLSNAYYGNGQDAVLTFTLDALPVTGKITINADCLASAESTTGKINNGRATSNSFVYVPTQTGSQKITFKTTDAQSTGNVSLQDGDLDLGSANNRRTSYVSGLSLSPSNVTFGEDKEVDITFTVAVKQNVWIKLVNLTPINGSLDEDNIMVFTPTQTGKQTVKVKTTSFAGAISVDVLVPETNFSMGKKSGNRTLGNVTVKVNSSNAPSDKTSVNILLNNKIIGKCNYRKNGSNRTLSSFTFTDVSSLTSSSNIIFQYGSGSKVHKTGAVQIETVMNGDANVTFN